VPTLSDQIEDLLPQTQCTKCGYTGCRPYAEAIAAGSAEINQCPPGGAQGIARLATLLGRKVIALNPANGVERARPVALIDENWCIGCTLCIQACPVDAILGAPKQMHTIIAELCTGCDLCVAPCPVDCISMVPLADASLHGKTGWDAWSQQQANAARARHTARSTRLLREQQENEARLAAKAREKLIAVQQDTSSDATEIARKKAIIEAALARARQNSTPTAAAPATVTTPATASAAATEATTAATSAAATPAPKPEPSA
jgi:electron transport complex protein RnfB